MQYLTEDDVVAFYREAIGDPVIRNPDGLSSAVGRPKLTVFGEDAYPTLSSKAAALMQSLAENQPFVDGNKRIAWICAKVFLQFQGLNINATVQEAFSLFTEQIANGMTIPELAEWIEQHISPLFVPDLTE